MQKLLLFLKKWWKNVTGASRRASGLVQSESVGIGAGLNRRQNNAIAMDRMQYENIKKGDNRVYRGSLYNKHNETMNNFADLFNSLPVHKNIEMRPNSFETFDNDGVFIDINTKRSIGYDWEYRDNYFANCRLAFKSLGQYERKLRKPSIQLSLQCDSTETGIAVGWHKDWLAEERERKALMTDSYQDENGVVRYTENFRIYSFEEAERFKNMIAGAMKLQLYSSKIFALMED